MPEAAFDIIIIGAGMAGASAAWAMAGERRVLLVEREDQPGYHSTGRSAALFTENYGTDPVRALTRAARAFFERPADGFCDHPLMAPRGALSLASAEQEANHGAQWRGYAQPGGPIREISPAQAAELYPLVDPRQCVTAFHEPGATDLDVHELLQGYLRGFRRQAGSLRLAAAVRSIHHSSSGWLVELADGSRAEAPILVNAAGAWADHVAKLAGVRPLGLQPKRRTGIIVDLVGNPDMGATPLTGDLIESFYTKPEGGKLMLSPADATPVDAQDIQPEELDIAIGIDRFENATLGKVRRVVRSWAGLRSFVADNTPVAGFAVDAPDFLWLAGQGGYGIQTAPAMAAAAASLVATGDLPQMLKDQGLRMTDLSPGRLSPAGS